MRISSIEFKLGSKTETLADLGGYNPGWQVDRLLAKTGILQRQILAPGESLLNLAQEACEKVFGEHRRESIDGLVYVTQSPDSRIPTTACLLHERLKLPQYCLAFDVNQGCSGFVYGLSLATALLRARQINRCLLVCAEGYSRYISRHDRTSRPIFGDGASAAVIDMGGSGDIGPFVFATDGSGAPNLTLKSSNDETSSGEDILYMMDEVPKSVARLLELAELQLGDIDMFVFHQASKVVLDRIQKKLGIEEARFFRNYQNIGNTVSATIPIAMKEARNAGLLVGDMKILVMGFGVGYSLAGCILQTGD
jgi:3-oxoacyl-[acyl-carrier-protein] synthase-3